MTLIEVMVSVLVLTLCSWMLSTTLMASSRHAENKRQQAYASEACFNLLEDLHALSFREVFARYNADPSDDPEGPGTSPGAHFIVLGLDARIDDEDGFVGRIHLPSAGPGLFEDGEDSSLEMPRDLNGDLLIDGRDHKGDYEVLPIAVEVEWSSAGADRRFFVETVLAHSARGRP